MFFGLAAHLLAAFFSIGAHQCDEIFQVYEFAGFKLGLNTAAELPWEFHEQMRSGIQPFIVYCITRVLNSVSVQNPFTIATIIRLLQSLFSFLVMLQFIKVIEKEMTLQKSRTWLWAFSLLFWCLPYFHARFSSENFSSTLFVLALVMLLKALKSQPSYITLLLAGVIFGIAFESRFQISFMIIGLFLWLLLIRKLQFRFVFIIFFGLVLSLGLGLMADHWLYGKWTLSWWNYIDLNLFKDKASAFGREPFYYYIGEGLLQLIPPFSLVIIWFIAAFWTRFKTHVITWITLPFILLHFFVAHKELRFLFPVLNFLPFMVLYYFQAIENYPNRFVAVLRSKGFMKFAVTVNVLLLVYYTFKPADNTTPFLKQVYKLSDGNAVTVLYGENDPYSDMSSLHYFRNPNIKTIDVKAGSIQLDKQLPLYFFSNDFNSPLLLVKKNIVFIKQYSSFPAWFAYLNFNGWVGRSDPFSIYKAY